MIWVRTWGSRLGKPHLVGQLHGQCAIWSGRRFRTFNVTDDFNRESLRIDIDTSQPFPCVIRTRDELIELCGAPQRRRLDNGLEFISAALRQWPRLPFTDQTFDAVLTRLKRGPMCILHELDQASGDLCGSWLLLGVH